MELTLVLGFCLVVSSIGTKIFFLVCRTHTGDWLELKLNFAQFKNNALGDLSRKLITTTKNNLFSDCPINAIGVLGFVTMSGNIENLR